ncbi:hypothetical protein J6590_086918 [Homalodisca vitripennis]|nr:hypothetical protein J6590_086918 [Homalodisca vitripennis]
MASGSESDGSWFTTPHCNNFRCLSSHYQRTFHSYLSSCNDFGIWERRELVYHVRTVTISGVLAAAVALNVR